MVKPKIMIEVYYRTINVQVTSAINTWLSSKFYPLTSDHSHIKTQENFAKCLNKVETKANPKSTKKILDQNPMWDATRIKNLRSYIRNPFVELKAKINNNLSEKES